MWQDEWKALLRVHFHGGTLVALFYRRERRRALLHRGVCSLVIVFADGMKAAKIRCSKAPFHAGVIIPVALIGRVPQQTAANFPRHNWSAA